MAKKQEIKVSEAKIIVFLNQVDTKYKYTIYIAEKLKMDYNYCIRIIYGMVNKGWIRREKVRRKIFNFNTKKSPIQRAREEL